MIERVHYEVRFPDVQERLGQDEEWIVLVCGGRKEKVRIHDYARLYEIPGLYEELLCNRLECDSPRIVCRMLKEELEKTEDAPAALRVLDLGAGNGLVGECLRKELPCEALVGMDIVPQALDAALRDRPGVYDAYFVMDIGALDAPNERKLRYWKFNVLITVGALGFDDIPTHAFMNAFNILQDGAWVVFNIKESFLSEQDTSGYKHAVDSMLGSSFTMLQSKNYCHRLSISGEPICYEAVVGRKLGRAPAY